MASECLDLIRSLNAEISDLDEILKKDCTDRAEVQRQNRELVTSLALSEQQLDTLRKSAADDKSIVADLAKASVDWAKVISDLNVRQDRMQSKAELLVIQLGQEPREKSHLAKGLETLRMIHEALLKKTQEPQVPMHVDIKERPTRQYLASFKVNASSDVTREEAIDLHLINKYWVEQSGGRYKLTEIGELYVRGKELPRHLLVQEVRETWVDALPHLSRLKSP